MRVRVWLPSQHAYKPTKLGLRLGDCARTCLLTVRPNPSGERASKHGGALLRSRRKARAERRHDKREGKQAGRKGKGRAELSRWNKQKLNTAVFVLCTSETSETALHTVSCGQGNGTIVQIKTCVYSNRFSSSGEMSFLREAEPQVIRVSHPLPWFFPHVALFAVKAAWLCGIKPWPHCELSAPGSRWTKPDLEHLTPPCERSSKESTSSQPQPNQLSLFFTHSTLSWCSGWLFGPAASLICIWIFALSSII